MSTRVGSRTAYARALAFELHGTYRAQMIGMPPLGPFGVFPGQAQAPDPTPADADDDGETGTMILFTWLMSHHTPSKQDLAAMLMRDFSIKIRKIL